MLRWHWPNSHFERIYFHLLPCHFISLLRRVTLHREVRQAVRARRSKKSLQHFKGQIRISRGNGAAVSYRPKETKWIWEGDLGSQRIPLEDVVRAQSFHWEELHGSMEDRRKAERQKGSLASAIKINPRARLSTFPLFALSVPVKTSNLLGRKRRRTSSGREWSSLKTNINKRIKPLDKIMLWPRF